MLLATIAEAQIWKTGAEVLAELPENFLYNPQCFETPPNQGGDYEVTSIDINCDHKLIPQNNHPPYCVSLYDTEGVLIETLEDISIIDLELESPTIVVVGGHRIGAVENILSLGIYYPMPNIEVKNDCESITFSTTEWYHLNINGETIDSNSHRFLMEDLTDFEAIEAVDFEVELILLEENNNLNCNDINSLHYSYLPPIAALPNDTVLCQGANLSLKTPYHPTYEYEWNTGGEAATTLISHVNQDSAISVLVTDSIGCYVEATILIETAPISVQLPADTLIQSGDSIRLCVPSEEGLTYEWNNGTTSSCNTIEVITTSTVSINVQNETGCTDSDVMTIYVERDVPTIIIEIPEKEKVEIPEEEVQIPEEEVQTETPAVKMSCDEGIYIPNVLDLSSPSKENRVFQVFSSEKFEQVAIAKIFDRQGALLVQKQGFSEDLVIWEGKHKGRPVNNGVFAYWMVIETSHDEWITCQGDITVIGGRK